MILLGVDPHKSTHTATALDAATSQPIDSIRIDAALTGYRRLLRWAQRWPQRRWVVENASGLGRHLAQWLLVRGEEVVDVSSTATARVRQLSRGGGRKNDKIDAAAAATIAATQGDARPVEPKREFARSTSCMPCCGTCSPGARHCSCRPPMRQLCYELSVQPGRSSRPANSSPKS